MPLRDFSLCPQSNGVRPFQDHNDRRLAGAHRRRGIDLHTERTQSSQPRLTMFDFLKAKEVPPLQHWIAFVDGFQYAPTEFYDAVEKELKAREVPGMEMSRIEFSQGGILSDKRLYLRMVR